MLKSITLAMAFVVIVSAATEAKESMSRSDMLVTAFTQTCLKYLGKPDKLKARLAPNQKLSLPKMPPNAAQAFLGKHEGDGWVLPPQLGNAVLISRNDGVCSIFVRRWDEEGVASKLEGIFNVKNSILSLREKGRFEGPMSTISWGL